MQLQHTALGMVSTVGSNPGCWWGGLGLEVGFEPLNVIILTVIKLDSVVHTVKIR